MNILSKNASYASFITGFLLLALPALAFAQASPYGSRTEDSSLSASGAYHPPALYVTGIKLDTPNAATEVKGSFHVLNQSSDILGDIKYKLEILSPLAKAADGEVVVADTPTIYGQMISSDILAFIPKEDRDVPFAYTLPSLPSGEYRIRIRLITSQGKELGWKDELVQVTGGTTAFAALTHGPIEVPSFADQVILPTAGVNVPPNSPLTLIATADNLTTSSLTALPVLDIYSYGITGKKVGTVTGLPVTIASAKSVEVSLPIRTDAVPGVYYGVLTLKTAGGVQASSLTDYRWIVQGGSAHILSARIAKLETKQGGKVVVNVDYAGPADSQTKVEGKLKIAVLDEQGTAGTLEVADTLTLTDSIESGEATVALTRDLVGAPGLEVILTDLEGKILDTYTVAIPLTQQQIEKVTTTSSAQDVASSAPAPLSKKYIVLLIVILVLAALGVGYALWKKRSLASPISSLLLLLFLGSVGAAVPTVTQAGIRVVFPNSGTLINNVADGNWKKLENFIVEIFMNEPNHDQTYSNRNNVPLSFGINYGASNSDLTHVRAIYRYATGIHLDTYEGSWNTLDNRVLNSPNNACRGQRGNGNKCYVTGVFSTPTNYGISFAQQPATAAFATLQLIAKWGYASVPSEAVPANANDLGGLADGINTWVNFPTGQPTPSSGPLTCAPNARMNIHFTDIDNTRQANDTPTQPVAYYGTGSTSEQGNSGVFVDLTRDGSYVLDSAYPTNIPGLAVQRSEEQGNGSITIQLYSEGKQNKGKECVVADINLLNATFTGFRNNGTGNWESVERPQNDKAKFCKNGKDEIYPGVGTTTAQMISSVGRKNDTFTLYYKTDAPLGLPVCTPQTDDVTAKLLINDSKTPPATTVNTPIKLSWTSENATSCSASGDWTGANMSTDGFQQRTPTQVRTYSYTITCVNAQTGKTGADTTTIAVGAAANPNRPPIGVAGISLNGAAASPSITVNRGTPVQILLSALGSSDPDGWTTPVKGVSNGGKCEWNSDLNQGAPTFETTFTDPLSPDACEKSLGTLIFNDVPGTYTYNLLRITDASGAVSNDGTASVTVVAGDCNDGIDNDGDGTTDYPADLSCSASDDPDETNPKPQCSDAIDNDGDGNIDYPSDLGCTNGNDNNENDDATPTNTASPTFNPGGGFEDTR